MKTWQKLLYTSLTSVGIWLIAESLVVTLYSAELKAWESPPPPEKQGAPTLKGNPYLLFEFAPGTRQEQGVTVTINSMGMRGQEVEIPKPLGTKRFITTGDSSVFGFGVEDSQVFSQVAAAELGDDVEGLNAAVPGYSSYQSINLLRLRALKTEPDIIVIANIWSDNNFDSFVDKDLLATTIGFEESFLGRTQRTLSKSAIFRVVDWKLRVRKQQQKIRTVSWQIGSSNHIGARRVSINDYAQNLNTLVEMAQNNGAEVIFVMLANEEDLNPNSTGDKAWTPYRIVMQETAKRVGAPLLNCTELFIDSGIPKSSLFLDEMHPTAKGHEIMGMALAKVLEDADWLNGGKLMTEGTGKALPKYQDPFLKGGDITNVIGDGDQSPIQLKGIVKYDGYTEGVIHIDATTAQTRMPTLLNATKINKPGPFTIPIGIPKKVTLRAYIDPEGDGPDADDPRFDFSDTILHLDQMTISTLLIDLDNKTVSVE